MTSNNEETPKIQVDDDWKNEMKAEKEKLSEKPSEETAEADTPKQRGELPPASFLTLVNSLIMQILMAMGGMEDPESKKRVVDLNLARFHIDTLGVLQDKTKGNLTDEENKLLDGALHELRMKFLGANQMGEAAAKGTED